MLFANLQKFEKALVRRRLTERGSSSGGAGTSGINFKAASDKLESNFINETPLCDFVESFVYPRIVQYSALIIRNVYIFQRA